MFSREECEAVVSRMWPYLDGALEPSEHARIVSHLESCGGCRSHMSFARGFLEAVRSAADDPESFGALELKVRAALAAEGFPDARDGR